MPSHVIHQRGKLTPSRGVERVRVQVGINSGRWAGSADAGHELRNNQCPDPLLAKLTRLLCSVGFAHALPQISFSECEQVATWSSESV